MKKRDIINIMSSGVKTGRSLVAEHAIECAERELTDEERDILANHDIMEMDLSKLEAHTLAYFQKDAENMSEDQLFRRASDPDGLDVHQLRQLLSMKVQKNELEEGCLDLPDIHKLRAAEMFEVDAADVTDEQRRFAKVFNFRDMYTGNDNTVCDLIDKALSDARRWLNES